MKLTNISHSTRVRFNQRGASAIMFSLFFIMVISLISLSFAVLVRNDQRATLDKTLSSQAQLAAESGVGAASEYITNRGLALFDGSLPGPEKTDCGPVGDFTYPEFSNGAQITCITWDATPEEAKKTLSPYEGWTFVNSSAGNNDVITWQTDSTGGLYGGSVGRAQLPTITAGNLPIVKVAALTRADITQPGLVEVFYLVPSVGPLAETSVNLGDNGTNSNVNGNGAVFNVNCDATTCKASISGYPSSGSRMYYIQLIGDTSAMVTYQSFNGGNLQSLQNVQARVDVNVLAQDQSKRLVSYVSLTPTPTTWQPFYAVLADSLCKDMKVDGVNDRAVAGTVCPSN